MAECTVSRCSHERRVFRKELHKWSKEILYIIGLERLAEELMGIKKWRILVQPFTDLESSFPCDWFPEDTCYFCCAKKQPPYDPASGIIPTVESYNALKIETAELSDSSDKVNSSGVFTLKTSHLSSWQEIPSNNISTSQALDQPLDLSLSSQKIPICKSLLLSGKFEHSQSADDNKLSSSSVLKVPQISAKLSCRQKVDANSKRSYTEEELKAAIRDIQSGKLGTRRAAVIYGIPRSTLRNKVYKLANKSKSRLRIVNNEKLKNNYIPKSDLTTSEIGIPFCIESKQITSASESLRHLLKQTITQKGHSATKPSDINLVTNEKQAPCTSDIERINKLQNLDDLKCSKSLAPILSHVLSDIQHLSLMNSNEDIQNISHSLSSLENVKLPLLPDIIRRLTEERVESQRDSYDTSEKEEDRCSDVHSNNFCNVILKVPSFKPVKFANSNEAEDSHFPDTSSLSPSSGISSHSFSENKGITVTLKELISRSISQKTSPHLENKTIESSNNELSFPSANSTACSLPWSNETLSKVNKESLLHVNNSNLSQSSKGGKHIRPKRGRYRNYDRDNLARAVRAVQKGEMSVHRAGTYYGVPHSTLEYKVKERHLLRPRKRNALNCSILCDGSDPSTVSSLDNTSMTEKIPDTETVSIEPYKTLPNKLEITHRPTVDSYPSPLSLWENIPFYSVDFSQLGSDNFFASQMMRKLQENARNEEINKLNKAKDIDLIENVIKSTLEQSVSHEYSSSPVTANISDEFSACKK